MKVYLTADPAARAARRTAEQSGADVAATQADLLRRDGIDSGRAVSPLAMADDAHHIDTTPYTLDEVVDQVVALVEQARLGVGAPDRRAHATSGAPAARRFDFVHGTPVYLGQHAWPRTQAEVRRSRGRSAEQARRASR